MEIITEKAYLRADGRKGIRNITLVVALVECARHVAEQIVRPYEEQGDVHLMVWSGCYPNDYSQKIISNIAKHPNTGAVLFVSLGCEGMNRTALAEMANNSGRWTETLVIQENGGTSSTIAKGRALIEQAKEVKKSFERVNMGMDELIVGTICGGSDATSGITANPAVGGAFDLMISRGARCIFEETGELIGCEERIRPRAINEEVGDALVKSIQKASYYYELMGHGSFAPGNADGGLTTVEEKSLGSYCKSGDSPISGVIAPGDIPEATGLYLMDVVPEGEPRFGFPNINDSSEIMELIASGSHIILFTTGRGSVVGSIVSPVIKVCANPKTYENLSEDMDINAGSILTGEKTLLQVSEEIVLKVEGLMKGEQSLSEALGHRESVLLYKGEMAQKTLCGM
ncbi:UxaA family hydrolase [Lentisphaera profundi]|uniref:UxaA family hydrolase n=1 Tax=Lentisphaera profundi TaxID=1658616 RepID=A0ABY7VTN3_9BACT|nr:UxaA family hydrolase [Lentisphaera profundi]WDE97565.1 UxaA family hydrolase [Lentisphaera profundi]